MEKYGTNCSYTVSTVGTSSTWTDGSGTNRTMYAPASGGTIFVTEVGNPCPPRQYCALLWTDDEWTANETEPSITNGTAGTIYGKCQMLSTYDPIPVTTYSGGYGLVNPVHDCPDRQYCALFWTEAEWSGSNPEPAITTGTAGTIYGKCQTLSTYDLTPKFRNTMGQQAPYTMIQGCPQGQYCYLNWATDTACTTLGNSATGPIYGVCSARDEKKACPYGS